MDTIRAPRLSSVAIVAMSAVAVFAGVWDIAAWHFGSVPRTLAYLRGEEIFVEPAAIDIGEIGLQASVTRPVTLTNLTSRPVRIVGGNNLCELRLEEPLPIDVAPGESRAIHLAVRSNVQTGSFDHTSLLFMDGNDRAVPVRMTGTVGGQTIEPPTTNQVVSSGGPSKQAPNSGVQQIAHLVPI